VKRTRVTTLLLLAVLGGGATWFLETALVAAGAGRIIPPVTLAAALVLIGVLVVVMALPVRQAARRKSTRRVDPFYATRVVVLAKASSLGGALLTGAGLGIVGYLLTRTVTPAVGSLSMAIATAVGAIVLLAGGLVAEHMCVIPPDDDETPEKPTKQGIS
jgi:hypothetical protein